MRNAFIRTLERLAGEDERIFLVCGDIGYSVVEKFAERFPDRFLNVGVAEQNMVGIAAGLALTGKKVFTYSIVNFAVTRCLEQIRNDVCYHKADVTVVSVGGGVAYGSQGYTHHGVEDIAFMRVLPNMTVAVPGDPLEAEWATTALVSRGGPAYLRLARGGEPTVHGALPPSSAFGSLIEMAPARRITVIAAGAILSEAVVAQRRLSELGIDVGLYSAPVVAPLDFGGVKKLLGECEVLISVEEHLTAGGLGGAVAELACELPGRHARVLRLGVTHAHHKTVGNQRHLWRRNGMDADALCDVVRELIVLANDA